MSKGTIISGGTDGRYQVSVQYNVQRAQAEKAANLAKIADLAARISEETDAHKANVLKLQKLALEKRNEILNNIPESETISAWCADLTEDLTGDVGLIEVPGESVAFNIQPGYDEKAVYDPARDGQLSPTMAITPAAAFYNLAMLPGWQKWKPTYRYGTITAIAGDLASVALEAVTSTQQALGINQASTLNNVPVEYMSCNGAAFAVGDEVLVKFTGQDWANPVVVGFKDNPERCGFLLKITLGTEIIIYDIENDQVATNVPKDDGTGDAVFPCNQTLISDWLSGKTTSGATAVTTTATLLKYTPPIALQFPNYTEETLVGSCYHTICDLHEAETTWSYDYYRITRWAPFDWIESEEKRDSVLYVKNRGENTIILKSQSRASSESKYRRIDRTETNDQLAGIYFNPFEIEYKGCSQYLTPPDFHIALENDVQKIETEYEVYNPFDNSIKTDLILSSEVKVHFTSPYAYHSGHTIFCDIYHDEHYLDAPFIYASIMGREADENPYMIILTIEPFNNKNKYRECGQSRLLNLTNPNEYRQCPDLDSCTNTWEYSTTEAVPTICNAFVGTSESGYGEDLNPFEDLGLNLTLTSALESFSDLTATNLAVTFIK